ncbi:MAG TPA: hypothetical protein H9700_15185 [Candidatus Eisenbergiella intestinipullorum]|nr:hypothetical protein [Candidatus Eisenbergiella intestinipullorum]
MFYYNRQIVYMDLWKTGERVGNAGFLKLEETERSLKWELHVRGLAASDTGFFDLRDETGALVDKILLQRGEGSYERTLDPGVRTRGGRLFREICGIQVELSGGRCLKGTWKPSGRKAEEGSIPVPEGEGREKDEMRPKQPEIRKMEKPEETAAAPGPCCPKRCCLRAADTPSADTQAEDMGKKREGAARAEEVRKEKEGAARAEEGRKEEKGAAAARTDGKGAEVPPKENGASGQIFYEDKWEQLLHLYPQIHPFGDERMFLSITPGDFVILSREYQKLVHNSFLLHGYYNYRHVILGSYPDAEGENYYLGVPGVYYEREKMAAEMFGFEAFEGKREPAEQGDFGYYMKRVRI